MKRRTKPSGPGRGSRLRLGLLLATAAAFFLVPAAQAAANPEGIVKIVGIGGGGGEVTSETFLGSPGEGTPPINCTLEESQPEGSPPEGTCENEVDEFGAGEYGVYLKPIAGPHSLFVKWEIESGIQFSECAANEQVCIIGSAGENIEATAVFAAAPTLLTVIVSGPAGAGTVTSTPAGIEECEAGEECSEEFEGEVTLTAAAASGYLFAGWLNCPQQTLTTCTLFMNAEQHQITAVFVREGTEGTPGEGVTVTPEPAGENCANGGVKVESGAGTEYVCNGDNGANGSSGSNGATGPQGPAGPQGATGPRGPRGLSGKIVCRAKQKGKRIKVFCKVRRSSKRAQRRHRVHWRLMHGGRAYARGSSRVRRGNRRVRLNVGNLRKGRYVLRIQGQKRGTRIVVR